MTTLKLASCEINVKSFTGISLTPTPTYMSGGESFVWQVLIHAISST